MITRLRTNINYIIPKEGTVFTHFISRLIFVGLNILEDNIVSHILTISDIHLTYIGSSRCDMYLSFSSSLPVGYLSIPFTNLNNWIKT